jgi:very-short-patch-repair endonuclease
MTDAEHRLWYRFRAHRFDGIKFKRQVPLGRHIVDFVCFERRVVIEVDGGQHADDPNDAARDDWLRGEGFVVLRFWNTDVLKRTDVVLEEIAKALSAGDANTPLPARAQPSLRRLRKLACGAPPSPTRGEGTLRLQLT